MIYSPHLAYLLLYAANIDTRIQSAEREIIRKKVHSEQEWNDLLKEFEGDSEFMRLQKVETILEEASEPALRQVLLSEVRGLMRSDGEFSTTERYLLRLMERYKNETS
jgi:hypothetical protein